MHYLTEGEDSNNSEDEEHHGCHKQIDTATCEIILEEQRSSIIRSSKTLIGSTKQRSSSSTLLSNTMCLLSISPLLSFHNAKALRQPGA